MIYAFPAPDEAVDQGDVIRNCPIASLDALPDSAETQIEIPVAFNWVYVLTQACDLASAKTRFVNVALVFDAQALIDAGKLKAAEVRGPIRAGRVFGWYYLPGDADTALPEMIVDLRQLHTLPLEPITQLCRQGHRLARLVSPYREHLAKHFADTFSRIGLPAPYETG